MAAREVIGIIPAAGRATRLGALPCSKEILPIARRPVTYRSATGVQVILQTVLEKMRCADIRKAYIVLRDGKWDIPAYLGDGDLVDMRLGYLMWGLPFGVPYTLDQAYPFVRDCNTALGFGDILFDADDAYSRLLDWQSSSHADVVLGLFSADRPDKQDVVDLEGEHRVRSIYPKPLHSHLKYTWGNALWTPAFTEFLHGFVEQHKHSAASAPEPFVGDVIHAAIKHGLRVEAVHVASEPYIDIGTPEDLAKAISKVSNQR